MSDFFGLTLAKKHSTRDKKHVVLPSVIQHEKEYFDQSPLGLTDHFCNSVNKSLVDAVDTFQVWVARNLVTFSLTQCERVLNTASIGTAVSTKDIAHVLCEVMADSGSSPATSAVVAAAQAHYSKNRKRSSSSSISEDDHVKRVNCWKLQPIF